jgi:hypothetical protein
LTIFRIAIVEKNPQKGVYLQGKIKFRFTQLRKFYFYFFKEKIQYYTLRNSLIDLRMTLELSEWYSKLLPAVA